MLADRRMTPDWASSMSGRLDSIERRLSRIEGGLALLGFVLGVSATILGALIGRVG